MSAGGVPVAQGEGSWCCPHVGPSALGPCRRGLGSIKGISHLLAVDGPPMQRSRHISVPPKPLTKMGFDEVSAQQVSPCLPSISPSPPAAPCHHGVQPSPCPHSDVPPTPWGSPLPPQIFLINLVRRPDRRQRMLASLQELEIAARVVDAVDGR